MTLPIRFDSQVCGDVAEATAREWIETNGIGGFASSTIVGLNTRRYHGLLVAALKPPVARAVLLAKLEETLVIGGVRYELSANQYAGAIHPQGYRYLNSFHLDPFPIFTYRAGGVEIEKRVFLVQGENTAVIQYRVAGGSNGRACRLEVRPLVAFRDFHNTTHANNAIRADVQIVPSMASIHPYEGLPTLYFSHNAEFIDHGGVWFYDFRYEREQERGLDYLEDLYNPFLLDFNLSESPAASMIVSTIPHEVASADELAQYEVNRRGTLTSNGLTDSFAGTLIEAADQFLVARGKHKTVIAGYPWFGDWGRDTMISLPGLTLVTGRFEDARGILRAFAQSIDQGLLPNRFPEAGEEPEYNTADATLWMFHAVHEYLRYTGDNEFVCREMYPVLADIIAWHERGTRHGIHVESDGLLHAGAPGLQLTWMDVKIGDWVVTPRSGKPVEIQALWYNALRVMKDLAALCDDANSSTRYAALAARAQQGFVAAFWNPEAGCLYDVVGGDAGPDASIRPNQIFAVSLPYPLLTGERALRVIETVEWELLTPYGLRTLSPKDPNYRGRYDGDPKKRDSAYHQGTVWPWLLGPFLTAYVKVHGPSDEIRGRVDRYLDSMRDHLLGAGLGQISEVFDGDPPHRPGGCIAQAWSVAEVLRTYLEDAQAIQPAPRQKP